MLQLLLYAVYFSAVHVLKFQGCFLITPSAKGTNVLRSELTGDGLHLNEDGYKIWVKAIKKKI